MHGGLVSPLTKHTFKITKEKHNQENRNPENEKAEGYEGYEVRVVQLGEDLWPTPDSNFYAGNGSSERKAN